MTYFKRLIDDKLLQWKDAPDRKPLLLRGARQVGKSTAVREFGRQFRYFLEINLEKQPALRQLFTEDINVKKTCEKLSAILAVPIKPGETLLFIDEIQASQNAIMSLRYFKEDFPELHVIAAGSLLEFALGEIPSFGVGRIRSMYVYPFSFDEFLAAQGLEAMVGLKSDASCCEPLPAAAHNAIVEQLRSFYLVGGMPAAVAIWTRAHSYAEVSRVHNDILDTYRDDFAKYKSRLSPSLLWQVLRSAAMQVGTKFSFTRAAQDTRSSVVKDALRLLTQAGLIIPVTHSDGNGLPLGAEQDERFTKYLFFDLGVMQTMLGVNARDILLATDVDFVNKGAASEMFAGLEMVKYQDCYVKAELHYWVNTARGTKAEVDYLCARDGVVLPVEVKASTQGAMQSLWFFMRKRHLQRAVRTSLEHFGQLSRQDTDSPQTAFHVDIVPLYALSNLR